MLRRAIIFTVLVVVAFVLGAVVLRSRQVGFKPGGYYPDANGYYLDDPRFNAHSLGNIGK